MISSVQANPSADEESKPKGKRGRACDALRQAAKQCVKESECVQIDQRSAVECIKARDGRVPDRCYSLIDALSDCKRSMVDGRARFRGRKEAMSS